ncbi:MAG: hypothetical protein NTU99_03755 [Pseudanabaena sp. LacPavin_0818_WC45_MAG_42_6]|nr:hypothetical protein [Pseudanabaena sp. LacPavin_0818_WC45_MAG_42_6]
MTIKEQIIQELDRIPESYLEKVLSFLYFLETPLTRCWAVKQGGIDYPKGIKYCAIQAKAIGIRNLGRICIYSQ